MKSKVSYVAVSGCPLYDGKAAAGATSPLTSQLGSLQAASGATFAGEDSLRESGESSRSPGLPSNLPAWQKSYQQAREKVIRKLAVHWYADINWQPHGDRTYPLIIWSGTDRKEVMHFDHGTIINSDPAIVVPGFSSRGSHPVKTRRDDSGGITGGEYLWSGD